MASDLPTIHVADATPEQEQIVIINPANGRGYHVYLRQLEAGGRESIKNMGIESQDEECVFGLFKYLQQSGKPLGDLITDTATVNAAMATFESTYSESIVLGLK